MVPIPKPLSSERHFRSKKRVLENSPSQTINHIENPNLLATKIIVPHKLIPRESCCPPPET